MKNLPKNIIVAVCLLTSMTMTNKISAIEKYVIATGQYGHITIYEFDTNKKSLKIKQELRIPFREKWPFELKLISFSPNGQLLAAWNNSDNTIDIWEKDKDGKYVKNKKTYTKKYVKSLKFNENNKLTLYCQNITHRWGYYNIDVYQMNEDGTFKKIKDIKKTTGGPMYNVSRFSKKDKYCVDKGKTDDENQEGYKYFNLFKINEKDKNKATITLLRQLYFGISTPYNLESVAFNSKGDIFATANGGVIIWEMKTRYSRKLATPDPSSLEFSPDDKLLAIGGSRTIQIWNTKTWEKIGEHKTEGTVFSIAFQPKKGYKKIYFRKKKRKSKEKALAAPAAAKGKKAAPTGKDTAAAAMQ